MRSPATQAAAGRSLRWRSRRSHRWFGGAVLAACIGAFSPAGATLPPGGDVAPDYSNPASWLCSPTGNDCADNGDAGSAVQVPIGEDVGGDFENVPMCRASDQIGCVVTWASFRATDPPPEDSLFGRGGESTEAGCTNPAALAGGPAELTAYFPANHRATILSPGGDVEPWADPAVVDADVYAEFDWVQVPGLLTGECVRSGGFNYLEVTVSADPADPRADDIPGNLTPQWGLHLADMNLVMGDLVTLAFIQGGVWLAAH